MRSFDHGGVNVHLWNVKGRPSLAYWEYAMALTTLGIVFLIGATLSLRFKVLILLPAIGLAVLGTAAIGIATGDRVGAVVLTIALTAAALQVGYVFGLVTRAVIASLGVPERKAIMVEKLGLR
jgi:hypothetical protein